MTSSAVIDRTDSASAADLHDRDFYTWCRQQAALVRARRLGSIDWDNIAEELDSLGSELEHALESSYALLLMHLLEWRYQPQRRSRSWRSTIVRERNNVRRRLKRDPGLKGKMQELFSDAYDDARKQAAAETGLPLATFPVDCPFTMEEVMDEDWWPERAARGDVEKALEVLDRIGSDEPPMPGDEIPDDQGAGKPPSG